MGVRVSWKGELKRSCVPRHVLVQGIYLVGGHDGIGVPGWWTRCGRCDQCTWLVDTLCSMGSVYLVGGHAVVDGIGVLEVVHAGDGERLVAARELLARHRAAGDQCVQLLHHLRRRRRVDALVVVSRSEVRVRSRDIICATTAAVDALVVISRSEVRVRVT